MRHSDTNKLAAALEGVPLWGCLPGSPSSKAGLRAGDIILRVNGARVKSLDDYMRAKELAAESMTVEVFRAGEELSFRFDLDRNPTPSLAETAEAVSRARLVPTEPLEDDSPDEPS